jgi:predicted dehydrogenase
MKPYNVAIIGYGWVSTAHIQAINATLHAQVTAVYSSRPQNAAELSARHGDASRLSPTWTRCCCGPISTRSRFAAIRTNMRLRRSRRRGPASTSSSRNRSASPPPTRAPWPAVKSAGVRTCVCFECRFSSQFLATKAVIDAGLLGSLHYGEVDYYHGIGPWYGQYRWNTSVESGGSSLLSAGCHALDALLLCMGGQVESVTSSATRSSAKAFADYKYDTTSVSILRFRGGALGKVASVIDCLQPDHFHTHLVGSEGSLLDNKFHSTKLAVDKAHWSALSMKLLDSGDVSDHPYQTQFEAFFGAVAAGREMSLTSLEAALQSHYTCLAADLSAKENRTVSLAEITG